jgi:hypothetical protein
MEARIYKPKRLQNGKRTTGRLYRARVKLAWVFGGGLRRRRPQEHSATVIPGIIITTRTPIQPPPPIVITDVDPAQNDDNKIINEL